MRPKTKTGCVLNGSWVPEFPRAPRSIRRSSRMRAIESNKMCAIELLASLAGKLLEESETSSASSNGSEGNGQSAFSENVAMNSHEVDKVLKSLDHGSSEESAFISKLAAEKVNLVRVSEELPRDENEGYLECTSTVATSGCSDRVGSDVKSVDSKVKEVSVAIAKPSSRKESTTNRYNSAKLPRIRHHIPYASFSMQRKDGALGTRDDEKFKLSTKYKALMQPTRIGNRRIRKLLTSKYWQVAPKLKDSEPSSANIGLRNDGGWKAVHYKRKICHHHEKCHGDGLNKKQKMVDQSSLLISNGGLSGESVSNSPEKGYRNENVQLSSRHGVNGLPSSATARQHSFHSQDSPVKFSIKSFKVPELYIEVPESATVGSLKRTVMETITSLLGDGLRVGVVYQGKKVKDDNRTLMQAGITCEENLDMLGFTLEPNHGQDHPPLQAKKSPSLLNPQTLKRSVSTPCLDSGVSSASSDKSVLPIMSDCIASNPKQVSPLIEVSAEKTIEDSKALVTFSPPSVDGLAIVPADKKTKKSENVLRRTRRPFSVVEVEALVKAVDEIGTGRWRDIKLCAFKNADHRTYVDLKDKWKTLVHTAQISPQQRRGEPVPEELLERVLAAHAYWSQHQNKAHGKHQVGSLKMLES